MRTCKVASAALQEEAGIELVPNVKIEGLNSIGICRHLVCSNVSRFRIDDVGQAVYNGSTGKFYRCRPAYNDLRIRFSYKRPIVQIILFRRIHLAYAFGFDRYSFLRFRGDDSGHARCVSGRDSHVESC